MSDLFKKAGLKWFGNDEDGLSLIDTVGFLTFVFYVIVKSIHIFIVINFNDNPIILDYLEKISVDVADTTEKILMAYVFKKGLDVGFDKYAEVKNNQIGVDRIKYTNNENDEQNNNINN